MDDEYLPPLPRKQRRSGTGAVPRLAVVLAILIGVVVILTKCGGGATEPAPAPPAQATPAPSPLATDVEQVAEPLPAKTKREVLEGVIGRALGESNRGVERVGQVDYDPKTKELIVKYALNDNAFGENFIRIGGWKDNGAILDALRSTTIPVSSLVTIGTFEYLDDMGNSVGERPAFIVGFGKRAIYSANLENLPGEMLASAANLVNGPMASPEERKGF